MENTKISKKNSVCRALLTKMRFWMRENCRDTAIWQHNPPHRAPPNYTEQPEIRPTEPHRAPPSSTELPRTTPRPSALLGRPKQVFATWNVNFTLKLTSLGRFSLRAMTFCTILEEKWPKEVYLRLTQEIFNENLPNWPNLTYFSSKNKRFKGFVANLCLSSHKSPKNSNFRLLSRFSAKNLP